MSRVEREREREGRRRGRDKGKTRGRGLQFSRFAFFAKRLCPAYRYIRGNRVSSCSFRLGSSSRRGHLLRVYAPCVPLELTSMITERLLVQRSLGGAGGSLYLLFLSSRAASSTRCCLLHDSTRTSAFSDDNDDDGCRENEKIRGGVFKETEVQRLINRNKP